MIIYCHKCKRHFFAEMERCPHCSSQVQAVTWLKTASIVAFALAVIVSFVVAQKMESSFGTRRKPAPTPVREDQPGLPWPPEPGVDRAFHTHSTRLPIE